MGNWTAIVQEIWRDGCFWAALWIGTFGIVLCLRRDRAEERAERLVCQPTCMSCRWPVDLCACPTEAQRRSAH